MNVSLLYVILAGLGILTAAGLAVFGSYSGDADLTSNAYDLLKVLFGGVAGALGASAKT